MVYKELRETLIDFMENGAVLTLKSLLNTLIQCKDIKSLAFSFSSALNICNEKDIKLNFEENYMTGYIADKYENEIYNNIGINIYNEDSKLIETIWFGRTDILSPEQRTNIKGEPLTDCKVRLSDEINIIAFTNEHGVTEQAIDRRILFEEGANYA